MVFLGCVHLCASSLYSLRVVSICMCMCPVCISVSSIFNDESHVNIDKNPLYNKILFWSLCGVLCIMVLGLDVNCFSYIPGYRQGRLRRPQSPRCVSVRYENESCRIFDKAWSGKAPSASISKVCWWIDVCWITHLWYSRCRATHTHTHNCTCTRIHECMGGGARMLERDWVLYSYVWHDWFIYHSPSFFPLFLISPPPIPRLWGDYNVENRSIHRSLLQKNNIKSKVWDLWQMRAGNSLESNQFFGV